MDFSQMVNYLRDKNKGKIFFIKSGVFYIAVAQDAVFLSKTLLLRTTCHKKNICKVGVPVGSIDKYLRKLDNLGYGYVVYSFDKLNAELKLEAKKEGKSHNETAFKKKCYLCRDDMDILDDAYKEALCKLYESERKREPNTTINTENN